MQQLSQNSDRHMREASIPFELLAEELGAVAGRVEREASLRITALVADIERRFAEKELQLERFQKALETLIATNVDMMRRLVDDRVASVRDGVDGAAGKDGADGRNGIDGSEGAPGQVGAQGIPGPQGVPGVQGDKGDRGEAGAAGKDGADGAQGLTGKDGAPGKLPQVKVWAEGVSYAGEVFTHKGALYQAINDTGTEPAATLPDWLCLAAAGSDGSNGRDGVDGRSLTICETFDPDDEYAALDVVTLDHRWFVAKYDNPGVCPGPGWKAGPGIGKTGKPGPPGERGPKGENIAAPVIVGWETRSEAFEIIPIMSDGGLGPAASIRDLFAQFQAEGG